MCLFFLFFNFGRGLVCISCQKKFFFYSFFLCPSFGIFCSRQKLNKLKNEIPKIPRKPYKILHTGDTKYFKRCVHYQQNHIHIFKESAHWDDSVIEVIEVAGLVYYDGIPRVSFCKSIPFLAFKKFFVDNKKLVWAVQNYFLLGSKTSKKSFITFKSVQ